MAEPYRLELVIAGLPCPTNRQASMHWREKGKHANEWKRMVALTVGARRPKAPLKRAKLTLTRYSSAAPDYDGLVSSFKHAIDGLVACGVLEDDSLAHIGVPQFSWQKASPEKGRITIAVEEIPTERKTDAA